MSSGQEGAIEKREGQVREYSPLSLRITRKDLWLSEGGGQSRGNQSALE